ncbi:MAG: hypothetical protein E7054_05750 [Lentisphaerae bacterium]|nr:hypothetical protein [Lentisphaerota bacterium]
MTKLTGIFKFFLLPVLTVFAVLQLSAANDELKNLSEDDFKYLRGDSWQVVGNNVILTGRVHLPLGNTEIFADKAIINLGSRDFEAIGNVRVFCWTDISGASTLQRIAELEKSPSILIKDVSVSQDIMGNRVYSVKASTQTDAITADRVCGNWDSGYFRFDNVIFTYNSFICRGRVAEHLPSGETIITDGEFSACNYLVSNNAHYSVAASKIKLLPHPQKFYGLEHADFDKGDRTVVMVNGFAKIYGLPVLWLPVFWKPKDENLGLLNITWGSDGDWGYYLNLAKRFKFNEYPAVKLKLLTDLYEKRGVGYGGKVTISAEKSHTEFFGYGLRDKDRYETDDYDNYRLDVPKNRYDFRLTNLTHITPKLDFRGVFEASSDPYFVRDFFTSRFNNDPQPATYAALEQQFDRFSTALYMRFQVNDFYTTVERFPEIRFDAPRQEIFNTGLYYQSDMSAVNLRMKWVEFDSYPEGFSRLHDYDAFRFDMTHFLYYPIKTDYFNFVPRAGIRLTTYSKTSKERVTEDDLMTMIRASRPQSMGRYFFRNYDDDGGAKARVAAEGGFELSTKIHNTWQNVRNTFLQLDGLRHIMQPYLNYTYISNPNISRDHLYFFDEVDRLDEQNFFRFGLINRLQTRNGSGISDFLTMENFWDLHVQKKDGLSRLGNIGTLLRWKIFKGLSMHTRFLMDISGDGEVQDTYRRGRNAGKTGLALKWLNQWSFGITYEPAPDWKFSFSYNYLKPYASRGAYSMGSTLTQINATSYMQRLYDEHDETFNIGMDFPITPDRRTMGFFRLCYDVEMGSIDEANLTVLRKFHCWQLIASAGVERDHADKDWDFNYSVQANLTGLNSRMNNVQNQVLRGLENAAMSGVKF